MGQQMLGACMFYLFFGLFFAGLAIIDELPASRLRQRYPWRDVLVLSCVVLAIWPLILAAGVVRTLRG